MAKNLSVPARAVAAVAQDDQHATSPAFPPEVDESRSPSGNVTLHGTPGVVVPAESPADFHRLARVFLSGYQDSCGRWTLRCWRDEWWMSAGTHYRRVAASDLDAWVTRSIKRELDRLALGSGGQVRQVSKALAGGVIHAVQSLVLINSDIQQPCWLDRADRPSDCVALRNGILDLQSHLSRARSALCDHTPEWFSAVCLPYDFDERATCQRWLAFLTEVLEGDAERINLLQEWFGYSLVADVSHQKFLVLEGEGGNGKSVVLNVLTGLVGQSNVSNVPLESFGERFQLTPTVGKLLNIAPEVDAAGQRLPEGIIKQFTGGDSMYFDRKGIAGIEARPTARVVVATNNRPQFADRSEGLWRRMLLLPFRVTIPENRQDRALPAKLEQELPGIFNWSIDGLRRLRRQGCFTTPMVSTDALGEYRREASPARAFLTECCREAPPVMTAITEVYEHYVTWCAENGFTRLNSSDFGKEVKRVWPRVTRVRSSSRGIRAWMYRGLAMDAVPQAASGNPPRGELSPSVDQDVANPGTPEAREAHSARGHRESTN